MNSKKSIGLMILLLSSIVAASVPLASATDSSATIENATPTVDSVSVASSVAPTPGASTTVSVTITASDANGYQDLSAVKYTVYKPDGTTVHVAEATATSNNDGSGDTQTYAGSFTMAFHDDAALTTSTYKVRATATDASAATSAVTESTFNYEELAALNLSASSIGFGTMAPGVRSTVSTLTVTNHGNVQIDVATSGSTLSNGGGQEIAQAGIKYDLTSSNMSSEQNLTATAFTNGAFDLAKGASSSSPTYWQLAAPSGSTQYLPPGAYTGSVTISAIKG